MQIKINLNLSQQKKCHKFAEILGGCRVSKSQKKDVTQKRTQKTSYKWVAFKWCHTCTHVPWYRSTFSSNRLCSTWTRRGIPEKDVGGNQLGGNLFSPNHPRFFHPNHPRFFQNDFFGGEMDMCFFLKIPNTLKWWFAKCPEISVDLLNLKQIAKNIRWFKD